MEQQYTPAKRIKLLTNYIAEKQDSGFTKRKNLEVFYRDVLKIKNYKTLLSEDIKNSPNIYCAKKDCNRYKLKSQKNLKVRTRYLKNILKYCTIYQPIKLSSPVENLSLPNDLNPYIELYSIIFKPNHTKYEQRQYCLELLHLKLPTFFKKNAPFGKFSYWDIRYHKHYISLVFDSYDMVKGVYEILLDIQHELSQD